MGENVIPLQFGYIRSVFYLSRATTFQYSPQGEKSLCGPCPLLSHPIAGVTTPARLYLLSCARASEAIPTLSEITV